MDALDLLIGRLVEVLRREHPASLDRSITIAEIYQHLVPYRAVRADLGFSELAEYEHTLLRLLAGERDYARVDLPQVREELQRELRASNPILGIYRDYAAVGVHLNLEALAPAGPAPGGRPAEPPGPPPAPSIESTPPPASPPAPTAGPLPRSPGAHGPGSGPVNGMPSPARRCRNCREALPQGREVRFCPSCGESQQMAPCRACGTALEQEWRFCIRCGYPRRPPSRPA